MAGRCVLAQRGKMIMRSGTFGYFCKAVALTVAGASLTSAAAIVVGGGEKVLGELRLRRLVAAGERDQVGAAARFAASATVDREPGANGLEPDRQAGADASIAADEPRGQLADQIAPRGTGRNGGTITLTFCMDMATPGRPAAHEKHATPLD